MAEIKRVIPEEMMSKAQNINAKIEEWNQKVNNIYRLQAELDGMWDGNANDTFNAQWNEDRTKYNNLTQVMQEYCQAVNNAAQLYAEREQEIVNIIK